MKKLALATAEIKAYNKFTDEDTEVCTRLKNLAEQAMTSRQNGEGIKGLIKKAIAQGNDDGWLAVRMAIIREAFDKPVAHSEYMQNNSKTIKPVLAETVFIV